MAFLPRPVTMMMLVSPAATASLAILGALEPVLSDAQLERGHAAVREFKTYLRDGKTEVSLHVLAYNLKRVMNILGTEALLEAMSA